VYAKIVPIHGVQLANAVFTDAKWLGDQLGRITFFFSQPGNLLNNASH
jgi:hypothetical protein